MLAGGPRIVLFVLGLVLVSAPPAQAEDLTEAELQPPTLRWVKGHNILDIAIIPQGETHLAPEETVRLSLDDGAYFRIRWAEPDVPAAGRLRLRLPRVAASKSAGWVLVVEGVVCAESGGCVPFVGQTTVPKGPRLSGVFPAALVPPAPPQLAPPQAPSPKLAPPELTPPEAPSSRQAD